MALSICRLVVLDDAEIDHLVGIGREERHQAEGVGGHDLVGAERLAGRDELVARREDRDLGAAGDAEFGVSSPTAARLSIVGVRPTPDGSSS